MIADQVGKTKTRIDNVGLAFYGCKKVKRVTILMYKEAYDDANR